MCRLCEGQGASARVGGETAAWTKAQHVLARVHADVCGPMPVPSLGGHRYMLVLVDEWSRMLFGFLLSRKSDAASRIMEWCRFAAVKQGRSVVEFHSDGGGEFVSVELKRFFTASGISATTTLANTPQHNGIAERANRTVMETARSMLQHGGVPAMLWGEAVQAAIFVRNRAGRAER